MSLIKCTECGKEISDLAISCPNCGAPVTQEITGSTNTPHVETSSQAQEKRPKKKGRCLKTILIVLGVIILIGVIGNLIGGGKDSEEEPAENQTISSDADEVQPESEVKDEEGSSDLDVPVEDANIPKEYQSALNKAYSYSEIMHMSKAAIYNQLTSEYGEQFSEEAALYAMENIDVDWKENALKKAENYSDTMYMSKKGIYDQLISEYGEQFTEEEATYAIENIKADWNANALKKAQSYQENMDMSQAAIHDQLTSEYGEKFTKEEADYAIENLDK